MTRPHLFPGGRIEGRENLLYAAIHPFAMPGWTPAEPVHLRGLNWQIVFKPDGADYVEMARGGEQCDRHLDGPNVLIAATQGLSDPGETTRVQKPIIDAVRGLFLLAGPPSGLLILPAVWEGVIKKDKPDTVTYETHQIEATALGITVGEIKRWGSRWETLDLDALPREKRFALRWYYRGMSDLYHSSSERVDTFFALWVCIVTVVEGWHSQNRSGDPSILSKFIAYAESGLNLAGTAFEEAKERFTFHRVCPIQACRDHGIFSGGQPCAPRTSGGHSTARLF